MAQGDARARLIYETIGCYLGYAMAYYAEFYTIRHALILGRVTSGEGGVVLMERANAVLAEEFPELVAGMTLELPDEANRRVGQAIAAASIPACAVKVG